MARSGTVQLIGSVAAIVVSVALERLVDASSVRAEERALGTRHRLAHEWQERLARLQLPRLHGIDDGSGHALARLGVGLAQRPEARVLGDLGEGGMSG